MITINGSLMSTGENPYGTANQGTPQFTNNLSYNPTIEELTATMGSSKDAADLFVGSTPANKGDEPLFGTNIREAAASVKKLFGR